MCFLCRKNHIEYSTNSRGYICYSLHTKIYFVLYLRIDFIFLKDIIELVRYLGLSGLDILGMVTPFVYRHTFGNKYLLG